MTDVDVAKQPQFPTVGRRVRLPRGRALQSVGGQAALVGLNTLTGVLAARLLAPADRGVLAVCGTLALILSLLSCSGLREYYTLELVDRLRESGSGEVDGTRPPVAFIGSTAAVATVAVAYCVVLAVVAPLIWDDGLASRLRLYALAGIAMAVNELLIGLLTVVAGFGLVVALRVTTPLLYAVSLAVLLAVDVTSVDVVLVISGVVQVLGLACTMIVLLRHTSPARRIAGARSWRAPLGFAVRSVGYTLAKALNSRLDLLLLPLFVGAADVGLYAVATSVSMIVVSLFGRLNDMLLPALGGRPLGWVRRRVLVTSVQVGCAGGLIALLVVVTSHWLIRLVYGAAYAPAGGLLMLLLPAAVVWAMSSVVVFGLQALRQPLRATVGEIIGLAVTCLGLLICLPRWGTTGAAAVSLVSYSVTFMVLIALLLTVRPSVATAGDVVGTGTSP